MPKIIFLLILLMIPIVKAGTESLPIHLLHLPPGFKIEIYARVPNARSMAKGRMGTIFVGTLSEGKVYAVIKDKNHGTRKVITLLHGLTMPNGIAFYNGSLFVAEIHRILRYDHIEERLSKPPKPIIIRDDLPKETHHGWRYINIGPDGKLYIAIGMPCNVCLPKDPRFGTISRMDLDGQNFSIYTSGIRNSLGFAWDPRSQKLWFTDNGRDWLGDNLPPDKLNYAKEEGLDFGFPYFDGNNLPNETYQRPISATAITLPTLELPAHVTPLGMIFYQGNMFPASYRDRVFIAEHGSWNRSRKTGYQVISVKINDGKASDAQSFIIGFLQGENAWGRPVDLLELDDGSLLVSDDLAGAIYRISYHSSL